MLLSLLQQKRDNETKVSPRVILALFLTVILYHICEGHITWLIVHKPHPEYTNWKGFCNAFYCSFYKTATLGNGSGIAGIYYLNKSGIPVPNATGMYFFQYIVRKVSMAVYSLLLFTATYPFVHASFSDYQGYLLIGFLGVCGIAGILPAVATVPWMQTACNLSANRFREKHPSWEAFLQCFSLTALSQSLAGVIPTPAGIGSVEAVFVLLFRRLLPCAIGAFFVIGEKFVSLRSKKRAQH